MSGLRPLTSGSYVDLPTSQHLKRIKFGTERFSLATVEYITDAYISTTEKVAPLESEGLQGSTQVYSISPSSQRWPVLFVPQADRQELTTYWGSLHRTAARVLYTTGSPVVDNSGAWDRLSLELMRIGSLPGNWDGEGAEGIPSVVVRNASIILNFARNTAERSIIRRVPLPSIVPSVEGGIIFKWARGNKELKCTAFSDFAEVVRWRSRDAYESEGLWEVPVHRVSEHFEWLLQ
jgi:hypothetical protein